MKNKKICQDCQQPIKDETGDRCYFCKLNKIESIRQATRALKLYRKCRRINANTSIPSPEEWVDACEYYCTEFKKLQESDLFIDLVESDCFIQYHKYMFDIFKNLVNV